ncbi:hypothetical protein Syun_026426 [Stephania yunnanensis]|uniref:Uncharacterized protein n=1 Tax=Stephania yunnanensis TaxID=152371 RepID=A0AAP0ETG2_9MAGN
MNSTLEKRLSSTGLNPLWLFSLTLFGLSAKSWLPNWYLYRWMRRHDAVGQIFKTSSGSAVLPQRGVVEWPRIGALVLCLMQRLGSSNYSLAIIVASYTSMGLSISYLLSAWKDTLKHRFLSVTDSVENVSDVTVTLVDLDGRAGERRRINFKRDLETDHKFTGFDKITVEELVNFPNQESKTFNVERTISFKNLDLNERSCNAIAWGAKDDDDGDHDVGPRSKSSSLDPTPVLSDSQRIAKRNAAAVTLQKVYKSYRTRRNLADCAVVAEKLWWKALDFAALKRSSVSFFEINKPESAVSRWIRASTRVAKIDPRHRYGHNLHLYYDVWFECESAQPFFYWLDVGDGKEVNHEKCPRSVLQYQCIEYLGRKEREAYEVVVDNGRLIYRQSGILLDTPETSKWIFVLSTSRSLYVGEKKKGFFQHSSFLAGGATTAAGRLIARNGTLEAIWPYSGHYLPTEENFKEFIHFLKEQLVDLTNVKRYSIDGENLSFKITEGEDPSSIAPSTDAQAVSNVAEQPKETASSAIVDDQGKQRIGTDAANAKEEAITFELGKPLSRKWSTGVGPRIGCVRDYPTELRFRALEISNLSPRARVTCGGNGGGGAIPSPRPSPKVRLSPRLSYMGLPSPRESEPIN